MANPLLQQARQRKMFYWGAVAVLFTVSLIHRYWIINNQAKILQLRETVRGEVELTSSAVRLMLTGSRGIAVTMLWYNAMDKQKRGEWHELELLVKSITKLQPYFITPWLYQSWNISFNVAVECDKPRDKYYYISRGLELLAEGERRNRGTGDAAAPDDPKRVVYPGNPDLRYYMGFTYQLKIGTSDERLTMKSLLEMSCIDPIERNPEKFLTVDELNRPMVKVKELEAFCHKYPRLVRRLHEQLSMQPKAIVQFMKEHQSIPSRFKPAKPNATQSELKGEWIGGRFDPMDQFPILPPPERDWPNPANRDLTNESLDVFLVCRTWYEFAQKPLPPPDPRPKLTIQSYDKLRYRLPKNMMTQLFRQYPARAQVYIAETLESEGFFDNEGWDLFGLLNLRSGRDDSSVVGREPKYHSRRAWELGFEMYREFGLRNGIYISPEEVKKLEAKAQKFRKQAIPGKVLKPGEMLPEQANWDKDKLGESFEAHSRLFHSSYYRGVSNFDTFFYQAEGERDPVTAYARKLIFRAERKRKTEVRSELMLMEYEKAWPMYVHACFKHPRFAQVASMQEEFAEIYQRYLGETQAVHLEAFRQAALAAARVSVPPLPDWRGIAAHQNLATRRFYGPNEKFQAALTAARVSVPPSPDWRAILAHQELAQRHLYAKEEKDKGEYQQLLLKITPIKTRTGMLDRVQYYNGDGASEVREALFLFTQGAALSMSTSYPGTVCYPGHAAHFLTRLAPDVDSVPDHWLPVVTKDNRKIAANRLGLDR